MDTTSSAVSVIPASSPRGVDGLTPVLVGTPNTATSYTAGCSSRAALMSAG